MVDDRNVTIPRTDPMPGLRRAKLNAELFLDNDYQFNGI
jgi:hypothetical protein